MGRNDVRAQQQTSTAASASSSTAHPEWGQQQHIASPVKEEGIGQIVPLLHQLADHVDAERKVAAARNVTSGKGNARGTVAATGASDSEGTGAGDGKERARLDTERQILLTVLLAHMCSEHDATPRTFVEQVLHLYEAKVLDSIQFLFDLGFVPRVALPYRGPLDRAAIVEAVHRQMDVALKGVPLHLEAWPQAASGSPADVVEGAAPGKKDEHGATAVGLRILSTSRYRRDFFEEGLIARGSFGDVYRTRHRLDGTSYATKKVVFRGMGISHPRAQAVMREVQCLAQLDHRNVVRYHTSWLESSWVENGVGHGTAPQDPADYDAVPQSGGRKARGTDFGVRYERNGRRGSRTAPAIQAFARKGGGTLDEMDAGRKTSLRACMDALIPVHMQPDLLRGLKSMVRPGDSMSECGSGRGCGTESDDGAGGSRAESGGAESKGAPVGRRPGSLTMGNSSSLLRDGHAGDGWGLMTPRVYSPRDLVQPLPATRDRGFSRWSADDIDSETSKWSNASSNLPRGVDFYSGGDGDEDVFTQRYVDEPPLSPSGVRTAIGVAAGRSPPHHYPRASVRRARRPEQFRHPSIDLDDLVSFGRSSSTEEMVAENTGTENAHSSGKHNGRSASGSNTTYENAGGGSRGRGRGRTRAGGQRQHGRGGRGAVGGGLTHRSVSPDKPIHYPVTLYIQMTLCPGDTLQDWLRKRNMRLSSESEETGVGMLYEASTTRPPAPHEETQRQERAPSDESSSPESVDSATVPMLHNPTPLSNGDNDADMKPARVLTTSPRTDPATSDSSGGSDETSVLNCCSRDVAGAYCPPPTRGTSRRLSSGFSSAGARTRRMRTKGRTSPAESESSLAESCEWKGEAGSGRVDLHGALEMFRQLLDGVAHVHSKGIIHRDIKPENVFVGEDSCLKIGDFGLSRPEAPSASSTPSSEDSPPSSDEELSDIDTAAAAIVPRPGRAYDREGHTTGVGTASYASPEQLQGRRYGLRADLFSLGLVLLELCCCFTTTHERAAAFQSMRSADGSAPAHLAGRSPAIAALADKLCRTVPEKRPSSSEALEIVDQLIAKCGCRVCIKERANRSGSRSPASDGHESDGSVDARLREELAAKTRIVEEQEVLIGQLQRKLSELSRNTSPAVGPVNAVDADGRILDVEALGLGLAALHVQSSGEEESHDARDN